MRTQSKTGDLLEARENASDQMGIGFRFFIWLVEVMAPGFWTNHRAKWRKTKAIPTLRYHVLPMA